ncbi:SpoIIIAH-like family protein [Caldalkalibacillus mannanilyticus]|uniref:SpoIIIAH-like family protein n=1 Tax=Caldalkalibacillus mannanilyticus TaxID=1418 RepID=UPI000469C199|nr:SpoIIIAH-like family protein [Caldalkalibacillus mannanilyticus]
MVLKKQTVWLLTMLSLMVVLSAYYLFNNEPVDYYSMNEVEDQFALDLQGIGETDISTSFSNADTNFFMSYRMERDTQRAQLMDEYEQMMNSTEATAQTIAEANNKMNTIADLAEAELTLESLIRAEGFEEAVVIADLDRVNVVVKSDGALEKSQALGIIKIVKEHLNVAGNQVKVSYR